MNLVLRVLNRPFAATVIIRSWQSWLGWFFCSPGRAVLFHPCDPLVSQIPACNFAFWWTDTFLTIKPCPRPKPSFFL